MVIRRLLVSVSYGNLRSFLYFSRLSYWSGKAVEENIEKKIIETVINVFHVVVFFITISCLFFCLFLHSPYFAQRLHFVIGESSIFCQHSFDEKTIFSESEKFGFVWNHPGRFIEIGITGKATNDL